jgi:hypothetical protein
MRLEIPQDGHELTVPAGSSLDIDPFDRVLRKRNHSLDG